MSKRFKTRVVMVGNVPVGGDNPIRIQSMTTSKTSDVASTVDQIIRLADEGCEIARVTVQGKKEALACEAIKNELIKKKYLIPLVADIHFYPPAAMLVADFVDKIRINPGNFADKRASLKDVEYNEETFLLGAKKIEEELVLLIEKCKKLNRSLRIGVNHGSLSDRVMSKYGNTVPGMVFSAVEFAEICRKYDYHEFLFSMKASNPKIMIEAYRELVKEMQNKSWDYPLHLGVTEAGAGEDGRIKSAIGIGALLLNGIGDTIRVSLTEDPWHEIDPCKRLINIANNYEKQKYSFPKSKKPLMIFTKQKDHIINEFEDVIICNDDKKQWEQILQSKPKMVLLSPETDRINYVRSFYKWFNDQDLNIPIILNFSYNCSKEDLILQSSAEMGSLFCDGLGDGICIQGEYDTNFIKDLSLQILQGARLRLSKTEFISCPGCGRTLFDIQETLQRIKSKMPNKPGLKIAVMGCIVNGPGEMADADFGYVGSGKDKVDLYIGKECVEKNIDSSIADEKLIKLIETYEEHK